MEQQKRSDVVLDFLITTVIVGVMYYFGKFKHSDNFNRVWLSLLAGSVVAALRLAIKSLLRPYKNAWKARLREKRAEKAQVNDRFR